MEWQSAGTALTRNSQSGLLEAFMRVRALLSPARVWTSTLLAALQHSSVCLPAGALLAVEHRVG